MARPRADPLPSFVDRDRRYPLPDVIAAVSIFLAATLVTLAVVLKVLFQATGFNVLSRPALLAAMVVIAVLASAPLGVFCLTLVKPFDKKGVHRFEPWRCPRCGYDTRGIRQPAAVCPECRGEVRRSSARDHEDLAT